LENINYSPDLLEFIRQQGFCAFCLDMGHLLLGRESVRKTLKRYLPVIKEIHIHGVTGWDEHLGLDVLPLERVQSWFHCLNDYGYTGILNLEVFDPVDLKKSLEVLKQVKTTKQADGSP
jgi:sugar phosphate isomerase/epimerase